MIARDLRVSGDRNGDPDWRFVAALNAALQSATVALLASGFDLPEKRCRASANDRYAEIHYRSGGRVGGRPASISQ